MTGIATLRLVAAAKNYIKPDRLPRRLLEIVGLHYLVGALMFGAELWQQNAALPTMDQAARKSAVHGRPPLPVARSSSAAPSPAAPPAVARAIPPAPKSRPGDFAKFGGTKKSSAANRAPLLLRSLPADWTAASRGESRKQAFVDITLPLITEVNAAILRDRRRIEAIAASSQPSAADRRWLRALARRYKSDPDRLLDHVDIIPPSLALAQAALESGWGTSRFAHRGNALFGEWTWASDAWISPRRAQSGKAYGIRRFSSLLESVDAYMTNINRLAAYKQFRVRRARLRQHGKTPSGLDLAPALTAYSIERDAYVAKITAVINDNDLVLYDTLAISP